MVPWARRHSLRSEAGSLVAEDVDEGVPDDAALCFGLHGALQGVEEPSGCVREVEVLPESPPAELLDDLLALPLAHHAIVDVQEMDPARTQGLAQ